MPFVWSCSHHQLVSAFETSSRILSIENLSVYETDICNLPLMQMELELLCQRLSLLIPFSAEHSSTGSHFSTPVNGIHRHLRPTSYRDAACDPLSASQVCTSPLPLQANVSHASDCHLPTTTPNATPLPPTPSLLSPRNLRFCSRCSSSPKSTWCP